MNNTHHISPSLKSLNTIANNFNIDGSKEEQLEELEQSSEIFQKVYAKINNNINSSKAPFLYKFFIWIQEHNAFSNIYKIRKAYQNILDVSEQYYPLKEFCNKVLKTPSKDFMRDVAKLHSSEGKEFLESIEDLSYNSPTSAVNRVPLIIYKLSNLKTLNLDYVHDSKKIALSLKNEDKLPKLEKIIYGEVTLKKINDVWNVVTQSSSQIYTPL